MPEALRSLPLRLVLSASAVFALAALAISFVIGWQANRVLTARTIASLEDELVELRRVFDAGGLGLLAAAVAERSRRDTFGIYGLRDGQGRSLAGNLESWPIPSGQTSGLFRYRTSPGGRDILGLGVTITIIDGAQLMVARDIDDQRRLAETIRATALAGTAAMALLAIAGGMIARRWYVTRLDAMAATSRRIMAGKLSERITTSGTGDELDRLAESLNAMLARIEQLLRSLTEMADNIAHDLRTPLTRLRNRAEAALRESASTQERRESLEKTLEEADALIKTFNALLLIARVESGAVSETLQSVDPATILHDAIELYQPVAEEAGLSIEADIAEGCMVRANRELLGQAVFNLLDNAIKYSARDGAEAGPIGAVSVTLARSSDRVEIRIGDRGPGIAPQDRDRALERFVRLDKSRTQPGTGLGLSLVAAVMRLHGGTIRLASNEPGLVVILAMPPATEGTIAT